MPDDGKVLFEGKPIRLDRKTLMDGRYHVITSPDVEGLYVTASTEEIARQDAVAVLRIIEADKVRQAAERVQGDA